MLIIGCDYHPGFQQIAFVDTETGECGERRLSHREEAEQFDQDLKQRNASRLGMESSGHGGSALEQNNRSEAQYRSRNESPKQSVNQPVNKHSR